MKAEIKENELFLLIERDIYNEEILHKCFYWYTGDFDVEIDTVSESLYSVSLKTKNKSEDFPALLEKIKRDLIDFKLRDIITKETKVVRELIVAKAFAYYGLEDNPSTVVSDPVGFNPESIRENG